MMALMLLFGGQGVRREHGKRRSESSGEGSNLERVFVHLVLLRMPDNVQADTRVPAWIAYE
jgi:hypothetical protein